MCLTTLAIGLSPRFPLVIAANRDEFFERPSAPMDWWTPPGSGTPILSGRDLEGGGTWLGLNAAGRFALLTNVRNPRRNEPTAPTRGRIVTDWLTTAEPTDRFWARTALSGHNGFNLIAADFQQAECFWASNTAPHPQRLQAGLYGLSNALLDTPWPKVSLLNAAARRAIAESPRVEALAQALLEALADRSPAPDAELPDTGIPLDLERRLSSAFIHMPDRAYGTRCSTVLITESTTDGLATHVHERSFDASGEPTQTRVLSLRQWPPTRYSGGLPVLAAADGSGRSPDPPALPHYQTRAISTCAIPASSNTDPRGENPARA